MFQNTAGKISVKIKITYNSRLHYHSIHRNWLRLIPIGLSLIKRYQEQGYLAAKISRLSLNLGDRPLEFEALTEVRSL